jgi:5-methylcytosine-specific restriction endonuclease McrA
VDVHHKVKHQGDYDLFFDRDNLEGLCHPCHTRHTGRGE